MLRLLVGLSSGILLMEALIHGPGRGLSLIPEDDLLYGIIRILTFGLFLAGAILSGRRHLLAAIILCGGLLARATLELKYSSGRLWFDHLAEATPAETLLVLIYYLFSFVLPALLAIDCFRIVRRKLPKLSVNKPRDGSGDLDGT